MTEERIVNKVRESRTAQGVPPKVEDPLTVRKVVAAFTVPGATTTVGEAVEKYARDRMSAGELLTWASDVEHRQVTFYVPDDVDEASYPDDIDGLAVIVRQLPRPPTVVTMSSGLFPIRDPYGER